jgi:hypothetical protein
MSISTPKIKPAPNALEERRERQRRRSMRKKVGPGPKEATARRTAAHLIAVASVTIVVGLLSTAMAVAAPTNPGPDTASSQGDDAGVGVTLAGRTPAEISHQRALMAIPSVRQAVALERRRLRSPHQAALMGERAFVDTPASPSGAPPSDGFDWGDAGIGAVATLTLLGLGTVALVISRRSRTRGRPVITS